ncbi:MAG TPA: efflux transporter outer membrane subunit [Allosphingosinicella sp.]|jgi:NodT family efflux transporter outer membrane factor (OMF) lipoprotein
MKKHVVLALPVCLAACAPQMQLAKAPPLRSSDWQASEPSAPRATSLGAAFGSNALQALIDRALSANADIGAARARVAQARAQLRGARAAMLPVVNASAGLSATQTDNTGGSAFDFSAGSAGVDVSWDADLFGRARAGRRAALSRVEAAAFDRDAAALAVEAEVARSFVQHAVLSERIALLDRNLASARELDRIIRIRLREGEGTKVETGLQSIEVRQLEAERLRLTEAQVQTRNALAVLVGEEAPLFSAPEAELATLTVPEIGSGQPAELLVRRPDVRAAEARIRAASGDVEQARAAFLPNLTLTASALGQAASLTGPYGLTLATGAALLAPIFNGGRLRGEFALATAQQAETVQLYRGALLTALSEAENALTAVEKSRARQALLEQVVGEARTTARLTRLQYIEGEADLRFMIDAQQMLVQAEDALAIATQERMNAAIDLYRALGGAPRS